jgi:hypothetical protein
MAGYTLQGFWRATKGDMPGFMRWVAVNNFPPWTGWFAQAHYIPLCRCLKFQRTVLVKIGGGRLFNESTFL